MTELFGQQGRGPVLRHCGSLDVDIAVGWPNITEDQVAAITAALHEAGYIGPQSFHWYRLAGDGNRYTIDMMTIPPQDHEGGPLEVGPHRFAPFWHGGSAFANRRSVVIRGTVPSGEEAQAEVDLPNAGALVVVKAHSMVQPGRSAAARDAYDIYSLLASYPEGPAGFVQELAALRGREDVAVAIDILDALFVESREGVVMVLDVFRERGEPLPRVAADVGAVMGAFVRAAERWLREEDRGGSLNDR